MKKIHLYKNISRKNEILSTIYFAFLLLFLPLCTLITFIDPILIKKFDLFFFTRLVACLFSITIIITHFNNFKLNYNLIILLIIYFLYLYNYNYGTIVNYNDAYYNEYLVYLKQLKEDFFYNIKKYNIISAAIILNSIITFFFISSIDKKLFLLSIKILLLLFIFIFFLKIFINYYYYINNIDEATIIFSKSYININLLLLIPFFYLNLFFLIKNKSYIEYIILVISFLIIFLFKSRIFFFGSIIYFIVIYFLEKIINKNNNKLILTKLLIIISLFLISQLQIENNKVKLVFDSYKIDTSSEEQVVSNNKINSQLKVRYHILNFYLQNKNNFNYFLGNSIFNKNLPSYPHNIFMDVYYCTGLFGLILFLFLIFKIFYNIKNIYRQNKLFFLLFFQLFLVANVSGFFFINITLMASMSILLSFNEKKLKNKIISFG
jgi:hypothetical protein